MPPTVIRSIDEEEGSLQEFIEDAEIADGTNVEEALSSDQIAKLIVFDAIIANIDRHIGNFLIKDKKVYAIDHGYAFRELSDSKLNFNKSFDSLVKYYTDSTELPIALIPQSIVDNLRTFGESEINQGILEELLLEILDRPTVNLIMKRIISFIKSIDKSGSIKSDRFEKELTKVQYA